ncbi:MAG: RNA 2',3'-cyclic phosphodiesterase [Verrucomicrobia bacterium]|nr:RNA 2',3'-cyclic phosphodiesterase [Verrucomicrobiota bacterium]
MSERLRLFVALPLPAEVIANLARLQKELRPLVEGAAWTAPDKIHLTLRFLGDVQATRLNELQERLRAACALLPSLNLQAAGVGHFNGRVLWVGVRGELKQLQSLADAVTRACEGFGAREEERGFHPHLTLARIKRPLGNAETNCALSRRADAGFGSWRADRVELIRSELASDGSRYTRLAEFSLCN